MADADVAAAISLERGRAGDVADVRSCWPDAAVSVEGGCSSGSTEEEPEIARRRSILLCAERCDGDVKDDNEEELANAAAPTMVPVSCRRDGTDLLRPMSTSLFCSLLDGRVSWREMRGLLNAHPCQNSGFITSLLKKSFMFHDVSASCACATNLGGRRTDHHELLHSLEKNQHKRVGTKQPNSAQDTAQYEQ